MQDQSSAIWDWARGVRDEVGAKLSSDRLADLVLISIVPVLLLGMHFHPSKYAFDFDIAQPLASINIYSLWTVHFVHEPIFSNHLGGNLMIYLWTVPVLYILLLGHDDSAIFRKIFLGTFLLIAPIAAIINLLGFPIAFGIIHPSNTLPTGSHHGFSALDGVLTGALFVAAVKQLNREISDSFTSGGMLPIIFWIALAFVPTKFFSRFGFATFLIAVSLIAILAGSLTVYLAWRELRSERATIIENMRKKLSVMYWISLGLLIVIVNLIYLLPLIPFLDGVNHLGHVVGVVLGITWTQIVFFIE